VGGIPLAEKYGNKFKKTITRGVSTTGGPPPQCEH